MKTYSEKLNEAFHYFVESDPKPSVRYAASAHYVHSEHLRGALFLHGHLPEPEPRKRPSSAERERAVCSAIQLRKKAGRPPRPLPKDVLLALFSLKATMKSYSDAARVVGVPTKTYRRWLSGTSGPGEERLVELRKVLGLG